MITLLRMLTALPLKVLAAILTILPIFDNAPILRLICVITGSPEDILVYLTRLSTQFGPEKYEETFLTNAEKFGDVRFVSTLGYMYFETGSLKSLRRILDKAEEIFSEESELMYLELMLASRNNDESKIQELSEKIVSSSSSTTEASELAYNCLCWNYIKQRKFDKARPLVDKILTIKESRIGRIAAGVLAFQDGDIDLAEKNFGIAARVDFRFALEPLMAEASYVCDDIKTAAEYLKQAVKKGIKIPENEEILNKIKESDEYREAGYD
ncbi:tetratricopeptide repeat protein [Sedimentisphaera salicampi]|uniref:PEP-CTERM system TPR-repeat lipoprotein n=1 Tax=Sedimentisphaera salicampi TaxID=1941349 RepID=A0A1W6LKZ8_9BACT|nr:hypothetical protein [Sedimentisphaera salicampi]ARN56449.1 hypothetical protein STSP1_00831 [Sedimentisphaera salicampi]